MRTKTIKQRLEDLEKNKNPLKHIVFLQDKVNPDLYSPDHSKADKLTRAAIDKKYPGSFYNRLFIRLKRDEATKTNKP